MGINKDPQLDNVQTVREFGALSSKWGVFTKPLPSRLRDVGEREGRMIVRAIGDG